MAGHTAGLGGWEALGRCAAFGRCDAVTITGVSALADRHDATPPAWPSPPRSCRRGRRTHARAVRRPRTQADRVPPLAWGDGGWQGAPPAAADGAGSIAAMEREEEGVIWREQSSHLLHGPGLDRMAVLIGGSVMVSIGPMLLAPTEDDRHQRRQGASHPDIDQVGVPRSRMLRAKPGTWSGWSPGQLAAVLVIDPLRRGQRHQPGGRYQ